MARTGAPMPEPRVEASGGEIGIGRMQTTMSQRRRILIGAAGILLLLWLPLPILVISHNSSFPRVRLLQRLTRDWLVR